jgi:hypothetical protein
MPTPELNNEEMLKLFNTLIGEKYVKDLEGWMNFKKGMDIMNFKEVGEKVQKELEAQSMANVNSLTDMAKAAEKKMLDSIAIPKEVLEGKVKKDEKDVKKDEIVSDEVKQLLIHHKVIDIIANISHEDAYMIVVEMAKHMPERLIELQEKLGIVHESSVDPMAYATQAYTNPSPPITYETLKATIQKFEPAFKSSPDWDYKAHTETIDFYIKQGDKEVIKSNSVYSVVAYIQSTFKYKIEAIKWFRTQSHFGLKEAKDWIETHIPNSHWKKV